MGSLGTPELILILAVVVLAVRRGARLADWRRNGLGHPRIPQGTARRRWTAGKNNPLACRARRQALTTPQR